MPLILSIIIILLSLAFLVVVVVNVARGRLLLRYSLLWIVLALLSLVMAVFPGIPSVLSRLLGFEQTSNFVFFAVIFFLLPVCFSLSVALSRTNNQNVQLIQQLALLEKRAEGRSNPNHEDRPNNESQPAES